MIGEQIDIDQEDPKDDPFKKYGGKQVEDPFKKYGGTSITPVEKKSPFETDPNAILKKLGSQSSDTKSPYVFGSEKNQEETELPQPKSRFRERWRKEEKDNYYKTQLPSDSPDVGLTFTDARVGGEAINAEKLADPKTLGKALLLGFGEVGEKTMKGIAVAAKDLDFFDEYKDANLEDLATYRAGQWWKDVMTDLVGDLSPEEQQNFSVQLFKGLGQAGGFLAGGAGSKLLKLSTTGTTAALGAAVSATSEYENAIAAGADPDTAAKVFWINAAIGSSESLPFIKAFRGLDKYSGGLATGTLARRLAATAGGRITNEAAQGFIEESLQEVGQQIMSNVTAMNTYDEARKVFDGVKESGAIGGIIGGTMRGVVGGIRELRKNPNLTPQESAELDKAEKFAEEKIREEEIAISNTDHANKVSNEVSHLPEKQKSAYVKESVKEKVAAGKAETLKDPTLVKQEKAKVKEAQEIKEQLLQGKDPDQIVTTEQQKKIDEEDKRQTDLQRLKEDKELEDENFATKRKELDGRIPEDRPKIKKLELDKKRADEDYEKKVAKLQPKEEVGKPPTKLTPEETIPKTEQVSQDTQKKVEPSPTPSGIKDYEDKKADIERRRQEELSSSGKDWKSEIMSAKNKEELQSISKRISGQDPYNREDVDFGVIAALLTPGQFERGKGLLVEHLKSIEKFFNKNANTSKEEINKKYDAELAELEKQKPKSTPSGIKDIYDANKDLKNVGSKQEYEEYLQTIFPNSQVKGKLFYHRGGEQIEQFDKSKLKEGEDAFYFKDNLKSEGYGDKVTAALLDIKNPSKNYPHENEKGSNYDSSVIKLYEKESDIDETLKKQGKNVNDLTEYGVYSPEQIHVLGSKRDIEGFKKWKESKQTPSGIKDEGGKGVIEGENEGVKGKGTTTIDGYEFTDTPSLNGVKVDKLSNEISNQIEPQVFGKDGKLLNTEGVKYLGGGWYKVSEDSFGGITLFNEKTKEAVDLNHKQGGRMGAVINDFIKNNSRFNDDIVFRGSKYSHQEHNPPFGQSGHYKGTYFYLGSNAENKASEHGRHITSADISNANLYEIKDEQHANQLKREAKKNGYDARQASGYGEGEYLKSLGYDGIIRGNEVILFDAKKFENKPTEQPSPTPSGIVEEGGVVDEKVEGEKELKTAVDESVNSGNEETVPFSKVAKTDILFNRKDKRFEYKTPTGRISSPKQARLAASKITPRYFRTWYKEFATDEQREQVDNIHRDMMDVLRKAEGYEYRDDIETFLMRMIRDVKFHESILKDLTDVSKSTWTTKEVDNIKKGFNLDSYIKEHIGAENEGLLAEEGFTGYSEQDVANLIKEIIQKYPQGIRQKDINDRIKADNPLHELERLSDDFLELTGLDINKALEIYGEEKNSLNKRQAEVPVSTEKTSVREKPKPTTKKSVLERPIEEVTKPSKFKNLADKIRKGKIDNDLTFGTVPFSKEIWNGAVEEVAKIVEATGDLVAAIEKGIDHIRNSDWYKKLSKEEQDRATKKFRDQFEESEKPPKEPTTESEEGGGKPKALATRLVGAMAVPEAAKEGIKKQGLSYEPQSQKEAEDLAKAIIDEVGIEEATLRARAQEFGGDVNTLVQTEALNKLAELSYKETDPAKKLQYDKQFAETGIQLDEWLRKQGRGIAAVGYFYKKSPLGVAMMENAKRKKGFNEWSKPKEKSWKEFLDELMKEPEFEKEVKAKVSEELKKERAEARKTRVKKVEDTIDKWIDDIGKGHMSFSTIVPPPVIIAALKGVKAAYKAGEQVAKIIEDAVNYVRQQTGDASWDSDKFRKAAEELMKEKGTKKTITDEDKKLKTLDRFRKKLKGLTEKQKDDVIRQAHRELIENGALEFEDFKKIIARVTGRGEMTAEEIKQLKELVAKTNKLDDAAKKALDEQTPESLVEFKKTELETAKAARELNDIFYNKPDIIRRLTGIMQLNTLGIVSLINNPVYNIWNQATLRFPVGVVNDIIDRSISAVANAAGKEYNREYNILESQAEFWNMLGVGTKESVRQLLTGLDRADLTQKELHSAQIRPFKAWRDLVAWWKGKKALSKRQVLDKLLQGTVGIPAEATARLLNVGDKPQRFAAEGAQGSAFSKALGLKDIQKELFMEFPREMAYREYKRQGLSDKEASEKADYIKQSIEQEGKRSTFQQDNLLNDAINSFFGQIGGGKETGIASALKSFIVSPYIKIPSNAFWSFYNLLNPEIAVAQSLAHGARSKFLSNKGQETKSKMQLREARYWMAHAVIGMASRAVVMALVQQGIFTPAADKDDPKKEREATNFFERAGTTKVGGLNISNRWFGQWGMLGNSIANKYYDSTPEQREAQDEWWNIVFGGMEKEGLKELQNGVFSNSSAILDAFSMGNVNNYGVNTMNMLTNIIQPGTIAQMNRAALDEVPTNRGDDFLERLNQNYAQRSTLYRKLFDVQIDKKRNIWGQKIQKDGNLLMRMFGISKANPQLSARPMYQDFLDSGDGGFLPPTVYPTLKKEKLTQQQHDLLQEYIGSARKNLVEPFVNDMAQIPGYNKLYSQIQTDDKKPDYEERKRVLGHLYDMGRIMGLNRFVKDYPEFEKSIDDEVEKAMKDLPFDIFKAIMEVKKFEPPK